MSTTWFIRIGAFIGIHDYFAVIGPFGYHGKLLVQTYRVQRLTQKVMKMQVHEAVNEQVIFE